MMMKAKGDELSSLSPALYPAIVARGSWHLSEIKEFELSHGCASTFYSFDGLNQNEYLAK